MRRIMVLAMALGLSSSALAEQEEPQVEKSPAQVDQKAEKPKDAVADVTSVDAARALCLATRPPERVLFEGDAMERAAAKEKYMAERAAAVDKLYRLRLPPDGFRLGEYSSKDQTLDLDLSFAPRALQGAITLVLPNDAPMAFDIPSQQAKQLAAAVKSGKATLTAFFELNEDQGAVCTGSVAAGVFNIAALPVSFELVDESAHVVGRAESPRADRYRALIGGYSGTPTATLGAVESDGSDVIPVARKLAATIDPLKKCYTERLRERNNASGSAVIGVAVKGSGQVESVTFIADALGDQVLHDCVESTFKSTNFAGVPGLPMLFRVPVELKLSRK